MSDRKPQVTVYVVDNDNHLRRFMAEQEQAFAATSRETDAPAPRVIVVGSSLREVAEVAFGVELPDARNDFHVIDGYLHPGVDVPDEEPEVVEEPEPDDEDEDDEDTVKSLVDNNSREELNALAIEMGVENPESLATKADVAEAIVSADEDDDEE